MTTVLARRVLTPDGMVGPAAVDVEGDTVARVRTVSGATPDVTLAPGFVDLQVNGLDDVDVAHARGTDWDRLDRRLAASGVTTWCPTVVSAPRSEIDEALGAIAAAAARPAAPGRPVIAGAHVEGPFLGQARGAHAADHIRPVDLHWLRRLPPVVRIVTLAPELAGATDAVALLRDRGVVVSLGHSRADERDSLAAIAAGAAMVTHLFNAMGPLHHRDVGLAAVALTDARVIAGLIADGVHVHPRMIRLAFAAAGAARIALVTDAVAWRAGRLGDADLSMDRGTPRRPDGTLAGTTLTMAAAVRQVVAAGVDLADALVAASTTPARVLGLADRGRIAPGARADFVALDHGLDPVGTWIGGRATER